MTKQQFLDAFKSALSTENVSSDFISEQCALLSGKLDTLSESELEKRATPENVNYLARSAIDEYLSRTRHTTYPSANDTDSENTENTEESDVEDVSEAENDASEADASEADENTAPEEDTESSEITEDGASEDGNGDTTLIAEPTKKIESIREDASEDEYVSMSASDDIVTVDMTPVISAPKKKFGTAFVEFFKNLIKKAESRSSAVIFTILTILALPLILLAASVSLGALVSVYLLLAGVIVAIVGVILAVVFGGGLISVVSLLYGATQIMQSPRYVGIHEIGFSFVVIGLTLLISVLLYNVAVRLIPWILSKASTLFKFLVSNVKKLADKARKGCDKL